MDNKHTPGPWSSDHLVADPRNDYLRITADGKTVAVLPKLFNSGRPFEQDSNARLIATAPELLVSLEAIISEAGPNAGLDDERIRDQMLTMLIAGHDTSTALLAWTFYLLGSHPQVLKTLVREID